MSEFRGFPDGRVSHTSIPDLFFSEVLPLIDSLVELKVTLHVLWRLSHKKAADQYVTLRELLADGTLLRGLHGLGSSSEEALRNGLERAVTRGTLLHLKAGEGEEHLYLANSARGRGTLEKALSGELKPVKHAMFVEPAELTERPNIFVLYEQNIGLLQPMIAEELKVAEQTYPAEWVEDAFHIAVENNVRNWNYIRRILERWAAEGKDEGRKREKSWYQEYGKLIKR